VYFVQNDENNRGNIVSTIAINGAAPKAGEGRLLPDLVIRIVIKQYFLIITIERWQEKYFHALSIRYSLNQMNFEVKKGQNSRSRQTRFPDYAITGRRQ
jgi:hypothetical protein